jgi:hypothetical protein
LGAPLELGQVRRGARFRDERAPERGSRGHDELGRKAAEEPQAASRAVPPRGVFGARKRFEEVLDGERIVGRGDEHRFSDELAAPPDVSRDLDRFAELRGADQVAQADGEASRLRKEPRAAGPAGRDDAGQDLLRARGTESRERGERSVAARGFEVGERRDSEPMAEDVDLPRSEARDPVQGRERRREPRSKVLEVREAPGGQKCGDLLEDRRADPGDAPEGPVGYRAGDVAGKGRERACRVGVGADFEFVLAGKAQQEADFLQERGGFRPLQEEVPADPGGEAASRIRNLPWNASRRAVPGGRVKARKISRASRSR